MTPRLPFPSSPWPIRAAGAAMLLIALVLLGVGERADGLRYAAEQALGGFVLSGAAARPDASSDGQLVLAAGPVQVATPARDSQFGISANAPALIRKVEMFQWREINVGHGPTYELDWVDHAVDSTKFAQPVGHQNPPALPFDGARFDADDVHVQGFRIGDELVRSIPGEQPYAPDLHALPPNMAATFQARDDGTLGTSADPAHPQLGDLRVSWLVVAPNKLTVLARAQQGTLVETRDASGKPLAQVQLGVRSLRDVLPDMPPRPRVLWLRRFIAVLLGTLGAVALLRGTRRAHDLALACVFAVMPLALVAMFCWLGASVAGTLLWLLLAAVAAAGAWWRLRRAPMADTQPAQTDHGSDA